MLKPRTELFFVEGSIVRGVWSNHVWSEIIYIYKKKNSVSATVKLARYAHLV